MSQNEKTEIKAKAKRNIVEPGLRVEKFLRKHLTDGVLLSASAIKAFKHLGGTVLRKMTQRMTEKTHELRLTKLTPDILRATISDDEELSAMFPGIKSITKSNNNQSVLETKTRLDIEIEKAEKKERERRKRQEEIEKNKAEKYRDSMVERRLRKIIKLEGKNKAAKKQ